MGKQIKTLENLETRIKDLATASEKLKDLLEDGNTILTNDKGEPIQNDFVKGNREQGFTVNQDNIEKALADLTFIAKRDDLKLKQLIELGKENTQEAKDLQKSVVKNVIETAKLNKLKTAVKDMNSIESQLYNVRKDKSKETTPTKSSTSTTPRPPAAPSAPATPTK